VELAGMWRYPVKSMQGEALAAAEVGWSGIAGDRRWGVRVEGPRTILSAKREGRLLMARATTATTATNGQTVLISLPSGEQLTGPGAGTDAALSAWLGRSVTLVEAGDDTPIFASQADETDDGSPTVTWAGRPGAFVDSSPVHLLTTASLRAVRRERPDLDWQVARFRPNLLVDVSGEGRIEDAWVGHRCSVGEVELEIVKPCSRCVMVTRAQPGGLERQFSLLNHLSETAGRSLGVLGKVVQPGAVSLHASVTLK
jgi:uncharacterized protein YcbX